MKMAEGLLLGNQLNVIAARVTYELANLVRSKRSTFRANQRMCAALENMLHVEGMHVQLERSEGSQLFLDIFNGGHGSTADVVRHAPPAHRRPVCDFHSGDVCVTTFTSD